jgi:hypothetical protein
MKAYVWAQSKHHDGNRDTADDVVTVTGRTGKMSAVAVARQLDQGIMPEGFAANKSYVRLAVGHGVTVVYDSGRKRIVYAD